ncbi:MAG: hypothetical protein E6Q97_18860 [Desulfurellales bacterium]|nr:MAG: hypothetical protein E6Q97_18860 [Desulfurellales bacterium]
MRRILNRNEYLELARKLSNKYSGNPSRTYDAVTGLFGCFPDSGLNDKYYKGMHIFVRPNFFDWDKLIRDSRKEKREFISFYHHKIKLFNEREKNIKNIGENRRLINQLKKEIKDNQLYPGVCTTAKPTQTTKATYRKQMEQN